MSGIQEGKLVPENRAWHTQKRTYLFSYGLGALIVFNGLLLCLHPWRPQLASIGGFLVVIMSLVTLSFLITTPENWVPALGDPEHGFPYLSGRGRLVGRYHAGRWSGREADSARAWLTKQDTRAVSPPSEVQSTMELVH